VARPRLRDRCVDLIPTARKSLETASLVCQCSVVEERRSLRGEGQVGSSGLALRRLFRVWRAFAVTSEQKERIEGTARANRFTSSPISGPTSSDGGCCSVLLRSIGFARRSGRRRYSNRLIDYFAFVLVQVRCQTELQKRFLITRGLRIGNGENELVTMVTNRVVFPVTYENVRSRYPHVNGRCCPRSVPRRTGNTSRPLRDHGHSGHRSGILPVVSKTTGRMTCEKVSLCRSGG
jgi:hypothetical protein